MVGHPKAIELEVSSEQANIQQRLRSILYIQSLYVCVGGCGPHTLKDAMQDL